MNAAGAVLAAALAFVGAPAAATAATAPGRVVYPVATEVPAPGLEALGALSSLALPDGGVVAATEQRLTVVRLRADGSLEPSFGSGGVARPAVPGGAFTAIQLLRRPDGRLVVVGAGAKQEQAAVPRLLVAGLTADGALDPGFGAGGFVALDVEPNCGFGACHLAALAPDGALLVTGAIGRVPAEVVETDEDFGRPDWVVRRVTPAGAVDGGFGRVKISGRSGAGTGGIAAVVRPTGQIVVLGEHESRVSLVGLTAGGARDRSFAGGALVGVPGDVVTDALLRASGAIDAVTSSKIVRYTTAGAPDRSYGKRGVVDLGNVDTGSNLPQLLDGPGDATTVWWIPLYAPAKAGTTRVGLLRVSASGTLGAPTRLAPAFGGGRASDAGETTGRVAQNSFSGDLLARPDGSYVVVGGVTIAQLTPSLDGVSAGYLAVAAFTSVLAPDLAFGGPAAQPRASAILASRNARIAAARRSIRATLTASSAGLFGIRVDDARGHPLARSVQPIYGAGTVAARIPLTALGRSVLRRARNLRVRVSFSFRDLLTGRSSGSGPAVLG